MLKRLIKKDKNEELEQILEEKNIDVQAKNLLQGILYKLEVSYKDYQKVKGINETKEQYVDELLSNVKKKCNNIRVIKISQKVEDEELETELKKNKFYVGEKEIVSYPIERKLLYAIEKKSNNKKILNNKYGEATIAVSDFINTGKNIDRVEALRDFNGWSWTTVRKEMENIEANLIYQILQILYGKDFLDNWCKDKDGIIDYFEVMISDGKKYGETEIANIKELLVKIAVINNIRENKEFSEYISTKLRKIRKELKNYEDSETNIERISEKKKQAMKQLKDIENTLGQKARLIAEYEKRNREVSVEKNIFNINVLKRELNEKKIKLLNEISEYNYLLNPMNYMNEKTKLEGERNRLDVKKVTIKQREELLISFINSFLQCFNSKIRECVVQEEILRLIYQLRYFICLPFNEEKDIKNVKVLEKNIEKTERLLVKKAIEQKIITNVPFEVMKHVFETRIIILEELYYKIIKVNEEYYVQIFDENVSEEEFKINPIEGKMKLNKKTKIFI